MTKFHHSIEKLLEKSSLNKSDDIEECLIVSGVVSSSFSGPVSKISLGFLVVDALKSLEEMEDLSTRSTKSGVVVVVVDGVGVVEGKSLINGMVTKGSLLLVRIRLLLV